MRSTVLPALLVLVATGQDISAQQATRSGPRIHSAGAVYAVSPTFPTPKDQEFKVAFEVSEPSSDPARLNPALNTVARYLNMHAQAGVPNANVKAAVVVHGSASWELLDDDAYRAQYGVDNPNAELIRELTASGVEVILCGQSAASRGVPTDGLVGNVKVALSAMTAFLVLQEDGYRVNPW